MITLALAIGSVFTGLAVTPSGQAWVSAGDRDGRHGRVGLVDVAGHVSWQVRPEQGLPPGPVFARPDGGAWLLDGFNAVRRLDPGGASATFKPPAPSGNDMLTFALAGTPDGSLLLMRGHRDIVRLAADGTPTSRPLNLIWPRSTCTITSMVPQPDGSVWLADFGCSRLLHVVPGGGPASTIALDDAPVKAAAAPDGSLWFDTADDKLGHVDTAGQVTFPDTGLEFPESPAVAPDGSVWAEDFPHCELVRMDAAGTRQFHTPFPTTVFAFAPDGSVWLQGATRLAHLSVAELAAQPAPAVCDDPAPTLMLPDRRGRTLPLRSLRRGLRVHTNTRTWLSGTISLEGASAKVDVGRVVGAGTHVIKLKPALLRRAARDLGRRRAAILDVDLSARDRDGNDAHAPMGVDDDHVATFQVTSK